MSEIEDLLDGLADTGDASARKKILDAYNHWRKWCRDAWRKIAIIEAQRDALRRTLVLAVPELHGESMDPALDRRVLVELVRPIYDEKETR